MMCVSGVDMLIKYYEAFKSRNHNLKIATIFSYGSNEDDKDATGIIDLEESEGAFIDEEHINKHSREKLDEFIEDYNKMFGCKYSTKDSQSFYNYYNDISKRVKQKEIDILLVVNMFLTGFDSKTLNTLYVDKNLKYHGLIQAFSRTNRILNEQKSQGNIVCFRNLKQATDDAIALFSNKDAKEIILMEPYDDYVQKFNEKYDALKIIVPTVNSVNELDNEDKKLEFVKAFRELLKLKNILEGFTDFKWSDLSMNEQEFEDYKSKYLDLYEQIKNTIGKREGTEKVSILEDVDFELELIHKDEINVTYILKLLSAYKETEDEDIRTKQKENISNILNNNPQLRSKRELIERFINDNLLKIENNDDIEQEFEKFWDEEKEKAFNELCIEENLDNIELKKVIDTYLYDERIPLANDVAKTLKEKPKFLERKKIIPRVLDKIVGFVEKFYEK